MVQIYNLTQIKTVDSGTMVNCGKNVNSPLVFGKKMALMYRNSKGNLRYVSSAKKAILFNDPIKQIFG